jgi:hypothetical protein
MQPTGYAAAKSVLKSKFLPPHIPAADPWRSAGQRIPTEFMVGVFAETKVEKQRYQEPLLTHGSFKGETNAAQPGRYALEQ